jgi:hypothetical protein
VTEAVARWQRSGRDVSALTDFDIRIAELGDRTLGLASGRAIWLDANAAGWGWFVDPTPGDDSEFTTPGDQSEQHRMDLLTVLEHEVGHLLGREHEANGVMAETLAAGTRLAVSRAGTAACPDPPPKRSSPFSPPMRRRPGSGASPQVGGVRSDETDAWKAR